MTTRVEKQTQKSGGAQRAAAAAGKSKATKATKRPAAKARHDGQLVQPDGAAAASSDQHRAMIATAAYYLAEKRGFTPGCELEDWLTAEAEITALRLSQVAPPAGEQQRSRS